MRIKSGHWFYILILVIFVGCASEKRDWQNAKSENTIQVYENFLQKYPQSAYSDSAQLCLEKLCFKQAQHADSIEKYEDFLIKYPQSIYADSIQILLEELSYRKAQEINTIHAYQTFIDKYSESQFVEIAKAKIKDIELLKKCPFELISGEPIGFRIYSAGHRFTCIFDKESMIKSLESQGWLMQGIGDKNLNVEYKKSGKIKQICWIDQPFTVSYNGKYLASFKNTDEYLGMLNN